MSAKPWDSVAAAISKLSARIDTTPTVREATLTSPTTVRFDTDDHDTIVRGSLVNRDALVGSRVLTLTLRHYVWVLGVKGGVEPDLVTKNITYPTLLNGWENYSSGPGAFVRTRYYKDALGFVHIDGFIRRGTTGAIFELPVGFRPAETHGFVGPASGLTANSFRFDVRYSGEVYAREEPASNGWVGIQCHFLAEA